jgi:hypothetical protein
MMADDLHLVEPHRLAQAAQDEMTTQSRHQRPRAFTTRDALETLRFEAVLVSTAALNVANGVVLSDVDLDRLMEAYRRVDAIAAEALR